MRKCIATDGIWDNLFAHDIASMASSCTDPQELAFRLVQVAREQSKLIRGDDVTPFGVSAKEYGMRRCGGKMDDLTVIVGTVEHQTDEEGRSTIAML